MDPVMTNSWQDMPHSMRAKFFVLAMAFHVHFQIIPKCRLRLKPTFQNRKISKMHTSGENPKSMHIVIYAKEHETGLLFD